jgi:hypothetical protein
MLSSLRLYAGDRNGTAIRVVRSPVVRQMSARTRAMEGEEPTVFGAVTSQRIAKT